MGGLSTKVKKKRIKPWVGIIVVLAFIAIFSTLINPKKNNSQQETSSRSLPNEDVSNTELPEPSPYIVSTDWRQVYSDNGDNVIDVHSDVFATYGSYFSGSYVDTVVEIGTISKNKIQSSSETSSGSDVYNFQFNFDDPGELVGLAVGDVVEIIGTIEGGTPIIVNQCHIVSYGEYAQTKNNELTDTKDNQIYYAKAYVNTIEYSWPDGTSYIGGYKDGEADGYGEMTFPDIGTYKGHFVSGKRNGFGTFTWENGDSYSGNWKDDAMDGLGTYTFADGYIMEGTWNDNQLIDDTSNDVAILTEEVAQIQLNCGDYLLEIDESITLSATISPITATDQDLTWSSSNPDIAKVTSDGIVTACAVGEAIITVMADNGVTATCFIQVYQEITSIWDGTWSIAATDSAGSYEGKYYGICTISEEEMTVSVGDGSHISLSASDESTLSGTATYGSYICELCYTSLTEHQILLEVNWVYTATGYDDVVSTYYYLLTRMEG